MPAASSSFSALGCLMADLSFMQQQTVRLRAGRDRPCDVRCAGSTRWRAARLRPSASGAVDRARGDDALCRAKRHDPDPVHPAARPRRAAARFPRQAPRAVRLRDRRALRDRGGAGAGAQALPRASVPPGAAHQHAAARHAALQLSGRARCRDCRARPGGTCRAGGGSRDHRRRVVHHRGAAGLAGRAGRRGQSVPDTVPA